MEELSLVINQPDEGKFLSYIGWNKDQIMNVVQQITKQYEGLTYTEEQMQAAKKDRANLNAIRTAISNRCIEVKKALLAPYDIFETEVKEVVALIDKPIAMIDEQTKVYEKKLKEEKKQKLNDFFRENVGSLEGLLAFDMIFNSKWLNKTASLKSCEDDITSIIEKTEEDLKTIEATIEEKYRSYAKDYYFRNDRNMTAALNEIARMKDIDRRDEEERKSREEAERTIQEQEEPTLADSINIPSETEKGQEKAKNTAETPEDALKEVKGIAKPEEEQIVIPFADTNADTKIYKASFTIKGTKAQIFAVKDFMISNNIPFGKAEK